MDVMKVAFLLSLVVVSLIGLARGQSDPDECSYESYEPRGTFESPGFPGGYPESSRCVYRIHTNETIHINFEAFSIEESEFCEYDYLEVAFANSARTAATERYCGEGLDKINGGELRGKGPLSVIFHSDESENLDGFKFSYEFESSEPGPCESDPCQNGGTCLRKVGYYKCECVEGFIGNDCETDVDECASSPCQNGRRCHDGLNNYTCECINDFTGHLCGNESDPCVSNPCKNGGLCINNIPDFVCYCPRPYTGEICEEEVGVLSEKRNNEIDSDGLDWLTSRDFLIAVTVAAVMGLLAVILAIFLARFLLKQRRMNGGSTGREVVFINTQTQPEKQSDVN